MTDSRLKYTNKTFMKIKIEDIPISASYYCTILLASI